MNRRWLLPFFPTLVASCATDGALTSDDEAPDARAASAPHHTDAGVSPEALPDAPAPAEKIATPNETAGSRLHPLYLRFDAADGTSWQELRGWHDDARNEPCAFQPLADGKLHCAPYGEIPAFAPQEFFSDAACEAPIIGAGKYGASPADCVYPVPIATKRYLRLPSASNRCAPARIVAFPTTPPLALTQIYRKSSAGCQAYPLGGSTYEIFAAPQPLAEVDPASFVTVTTKDSTPVLPARLRVSTTRYGGDDGSTSLVVAGLVDSARNELCAPRVASDGASRCMPNGGSVYPGYFANASCSQPAFRVSNNANCSEDGRYTFSSYMERIDYASCYRTSLFPRFTANQLSTDYYSSGGTCFAEGAGGESGYSAYASAALPTAIPPAQFMAVTLGFEESNDLPYGKKGSRLHLRRSTITAADGFASHGISLSAWDPQPNTACSPMMMSDGEIYCVGETRDFSYDGVRGNLFADPACMEGVFGVDIASSACAAAGSVSPTLFAESPTLAAGCRTNRVFRVPATPLVIATLYARGGNGTCAPHAVDLAANAFYRRSDCKEAQPSEFVHLTARVTE